MNKKLLRRHQGYIIIASGHVRYLLAASFTTVNDHPALISAVIEADGFHESMTLAQAVTGSVTVDMFTVQTLRAVIPIGSRAQRSNIEAAMSAPKRFLAGNERHEKTIAYTTPGGSLLSSLLRGVSS